MLGSEPIIATHIRYNLIMQRHAIYGSLRAPLAVDLHMSPMYSRDTASHLLSILLRVTSFANGPLHVQKKSLRAFEDSLNLKKENW